MMLAVEHQIDPYSYPILDVNAVDGSATPPIQEKGI